MTRSAVLHEAARQVLGFCEVTAVLGGAIVRVSDARGQEFVVKQHASRSKHDREVHAYRHWTTALAASASRLIAADSVAMTIVITMLPGQPCSGDPTAATHHQAGALLRRFHDTEPARELPWFHNWLDHRVRHWTSQARTLLSAEDATVVDSHLTALRMTGVPHGCHVISTSSRATGCLTSPGISRSSTSSTRAPTWPPGTSCVCGSGPGHPGQTCETRSSTDTGAASPTPKTN